MKFKLPEKDFYTIKTLSEEWNCSELDVKHLIYDQAILRLAVKTEYIYFSKDYLDHNYNYHNENNILESRFINSDSREEMDLYKWNPTLGEFTGTYVYIDLSDTCKLCLGEEKTDVDLMSLIHNKTLDEIKELKGFEPNATLLLFRGCQTLDHRDIKFALLQRDHDQDRGHYFASVAAADLSCLVISQEEKKRFEETYIHKPNLQKIKDISSVQGREGTYLKIIAMLKSTLKEQSLLPEGSKDKEVFKSDAAVIAYLEGTHKGLSQRSLQDIFAKAKKALKD